MKTEMTVSLYVLAAFIVGHVCPLPAANLECLNAFAPPTNSRGVNRLDRTSKKPLFRLHITPSVGVDGSEDGSWVYKVQMTLENELLSFSDAKISIEAQGPCGSGSLTFDSQHFLEAKQINPSCPRLLLTNRKQPMTELPSLLWTPPSCGCVQFRALVIEGGSIYYADNEDAEVGPLSQTVCVHKKATREEHLDALCHVRERYTAAEILSRSSFLSRHQLEGRWMDRYGLEMAIELRRSDNKNCCNQKTPEAKRTCFDDTRRRRVDRFCEDGYPDIPFSSFRLTHMREREKTCCFILGEHRYSCFASDSELVNGSAVTVLDFSQDETDPVNDLPEFASLKDSDVVQRIRYVTFKRNEIQNDVSEEAEEANDDDIVSEDKDKANDDNDEVRSKDLKTESKDRKQAITSEAAVKNQKKIKDEKADVEDVMAAPVLLTDDRLGLPQPLDVMERQPPSEILTEDESSFFENPKVAMSSAERRRALRKNGFLRNSGKWTGEPLDGRGRASREFIAAHRRVSAEFTGRRQSSAERGLVPPKFDPWLPGYVEPIARGGGVSRETGLITSGPPRLASAERRLRMSSAQRRDGWSDVVGEPNFDDEGGTSVEETLDKLQRKMERLRLKKECCEAGAVTGKQVYGRFTQTWNECGHSADKYVFSFALFSGTRACLEQFRKCCVEEAVSGPVMTSGEFREAEFMYLNNLERLDPASEYQQLERKGGDSRAKPSEAESGHYREGISRVTPGRETPEAYEMEGEKRFKSMRTVDDVGKNGEDDDEYDGPRRFDEADNDDGFDVLDRKDKIPDRKSPKPTADEEVDDFDDRTFVGDDEDDEVDFVDKDDKTSIFTRKETDLEDKKGRQRHRHNKQEPDALDRRTDDTKTKAPWVDETSRTLEDPLLAARSSRQSVRTSRQFRSSREGGTSKPRRFRSRNSRGSRRRSSQKRSSRMSSTERRQHASVRLTYPTLYKPKHAPSYGRPGALDSQEMAAAHVKNVMGALDSKEMATAYRERTEEGDGGFQRDAFSSRSRSSSANRRRYFKQSY